MIPHVPQTGIRVGFMTKKQAIFSRDERARTEISGRVPDVARIFDAGQHAHGIIAVGQLATGFVAIGQSALGVIAIGQLARGVVAIGQASFGIVSIGMVSGGLLGATAMGGIAGRKGKGFILELLPKLKRHHVLPRTTSAADVWATGEPGWIRASVVHDPNGNATLFDDGKPLQVKMVRGLRAAADGAVGSEVLAYTSRSGDVLVCEKLMATSPPSLAERISWAMWVPRFLALVVLAIAYWLVVGFPLIRGLVELG
jgi:hypothetical protein